MTKPFLEAVETSLPRPPAGHTNAVHADRAIPVSRNPNAIEIRQLRYFVAAVQAGSLRGATGKVGVSQPALTRQIQQLEDALRVELLVRKSRGIQPTDAGWVLFEDALKILALFEGALDRARSVNGGIWSVQSSRPE